MLTKKLIKSAVGVSHIIAIKLPFTTNWAYDSVSNEFYFKLLRSVLQSLKHGIAQYSRRQRTKMKLDSGKYSF